MDAYIEVMYQIFLMLLLTIAVGAGFVIILGALFVALAFVLDLLGII